MSGCDVDGRRLEAETTNIDRVCTHNQDIVSLSPTSGQV